jgi:hypothetical protein
MKRKHWLAVIAILALASLFYLYYFYSSETQNQLPPKSVSASHAACRELVIDGNCNVSTSSIAVRGFDANKDGSMDSNDTLMELCTNYYYSGWTDEDCKRMCGCP